MSPRCSTLHLIRVHQPQRFAQGSGCDAGPCYFAGSKRPRRTRRSPVRRLFRLERPLRRPPPRWWKLASLRLRILHRGQWHRRPHRCVHREASAAHSALCATSLSTVRRHSFLFIPLPPYYATGTLRFLLWGKCDTIILNVC